MGGAHGFYCAGIFYAFRHVDPQWIAGQVGRAKGQAVYAVVQTGGKQYRVAVGDRIDVERLDGEPGTDIVLDRVLMVADDGDGDVRIGTPVVEGAKVIASVDAQTKGKKVLIFKMRPKKRYRKMQGHRQQLTRLTIKDIVA